MDAAWLFCRRGHRHYWHDPFSAWIIAKTAYPGDESAILSALLHIQLDHACSADRELLARLELLAKTDIRKRKRRIRKREQLPPQLKRLVKDFKKMAEIQKFRRFILT